MPFCPSCESEFRAGFAECNTCHVPLVASLEAENNEVVEAVQFADDDSEAVLQLLLTLTEKSQAIFARQLLDDASVPSVLLGGHGDTVRSGEPYRLYVDEDYLEAAKETIESFRAGALVTGQIEGDLVRLKLELERLERDNSHLKPQLNSVRASMEKLHSDLQVLNKELE